MRAEDVVPFETQIVMEGHRWKVIYLGEARYGVKIQLLRCDDPTVTKILEVAPGASLREYKAPECPDCGAADNVLCPSPFHLAGTDAYRAPVKRGRRAIDEIPKTRRR